MSARRIVALPVDGRPVVREQVLAHRQQRDGHPF